MLGWGPGLGWSAAERQEQPVEKCLESAKRPIAVRLQTSIVMIPLPAAPWTLIVFNGCLSLLLDFTYDSPRSLNHVLVIG